MIAQENVIPLKPEDDLSWPEPADVFSEGVTYKVPPYEMGMLPKVYEDMAIAKCNFYGDNSMELYAGMFAGAVSAHTCSNVVVELIAGSGEFTHAVTFSGIVAASGDAKTPTQDSALGYKTPTEPLRQWDATIQENNKALIIKAKAESKVKLSKEDYPKTPCLVTNDFTMEALIDALANNFAYRIPLNVICGEPFNLLSNGHADASKPNPKVLDNLKEIWDNKPVKQNRVAKGISSAELTVMNAFFCTTPEQLRNWPGLNTALNDGTFARFDLYTSGKAGGPNPSPILDTAPINAWHAIQRKLQKLSNVTCFLEPDEELRAKVAQLSRDGAGLSDDGYTYAKWLRKFPTRFARFSLLFFLVDLVSDESQFANLAIPHKLIPDGRTYKIPTTYQWRAFNFLNRFVWPHQRTVYQHVIVPDRMKEYYRMTLLKLLRWPKETIVRDEVCGSKAPGAIGPDKDERVHVGYAERLIELGWIIATKSRQHDPETIYDPKAKAFLISPRLAEANEKHAEAIAAKNELLYGDMGIVAKIKMGIK